MPFFRALETSMTFVWGDFLESRHCLPKVETFANLRILAKVYTRGVCVKSWQKIMENRPKNAQKWIYLFNCESLYPRMFLSKATAKVATRKSFWSREASAKICTQGTFYRTQHMCPLGLLSAGDFIRWGFCPPGLPVHIWRRVGLPVHISGLEITADQWSLIAEKKPVIGAKCF